MNKKSVFAILIIIALIFVIWYFVENKELDRIQDYTITVTPLDDGTLNLIYDITWKVLDSSSEGPLTWVQIGIPNSSVDSITALSNNIETIEQYESTYVKIDFKQSYKKDDVFNFKFKLHQRNMYSLEDGKCIYEFTPGWFKDIAVDNITIKWKAGNIISANTEQREKGFYIWNSSLKKNEKLTASVKYDESIYSGLSSSGEVSFLPNYNMFSTSDYGNTFKVFAIIFIIAIVFIVIGSIGSDNYSRHRGYGGYGYGYGYGHRHHYHDHYSHHSSCVSHSSCASRSSCACACACAGGGRAGCSKKDFYGTKLKSKNILEKL